MKTLIHFWFDPLVLSLFLGFFSFSVYGNPWSRPQEVIGKPESQGEEARESSKLQNNLRSSALVTQYAPGDTRLREDLQRELAKYCPSNVQSLSSNIRLLSTNNPPSNLADAIEQAFKSCVAQIVTRSDKLLENFVKPVNEAYSTNNMVHLLSTIDPTVRSNFDQGLSGARLPTRLKELQDKLDNYKEYQQSCGSKINKIKFCFGFPGLSGPIHYDCKDKYGALKSYLETRVSSKSCGEWMSEFSTYARGINFQRFVRLPDTCRLGSDKAFNELKTFVTRNATLNTSLFSKCRAIIDKAKTCSRDSQGIYWPGKQPCQNLQVYPNFKQACDQEVQRCKHNCLLEIEKLKQAYFEYFYVARFNNYGIHSRSGACANRMKKLSLLFQQSLGEYAKEFGGNDLSALNSLGVKGQLEEAIVSKCDGVLTDLEKLKESTAQSCAKGEEPKPEEKTETKEEEKPKSQVFSPESRSGGVRGLDREVNRDVSSISAARIEKMDPNLVYWIEQSRGKKIEELQNIGIGPADGRLHTRSGSLIWGTYPVPEDLTKEEEDLLRQAFYDEIDQRNEDIRRRYEEVGGSPEEGFFDADGNYVTREQAAVEREIELRSRPKEPEPGLGGKLHAKLDPGIRSYLQEEDSEYRGMNEDERAEHDAGLRGKLRGLRRGAKRGALVAYDAVFPESKEAFRRRMGLYPGDVDAREVHKLIMLVVCYKESYNCGGIITAEDYRRAVDRLEELAQESLTIPDFSIPNE